MNTFLMKCVLIPIAFVFNLNITTTHPIFMSVTEIDENAKAKTLEISCKLFTDDFEKTLRTIYKTKIDLSDEKFKPTMDKYVNDYIQKRFQILANGKNTALKYIGYEKIDEAIYAYFEAQNTASLKTLTIQNKILYEYKTTQINLMHVTVNCNRQTTKLINPEYSTTFKF